jgi:hypothetical protein
VTAPPDAPLVRLSGTIPEKCTNADWRGSRASRSIRALTVRHVHEHRESPAPTEEDEMPIYAALIYGEDGDWTAPEHAGQMAEYGEFGAAAASVITGGSALQPTSTATTVHLNGGKGGDIVTTDGPFAETKEVLGGFFLLECNDLDEAIKWAAQIPGAWHGKVEVRPALAM